MNYLEIINKCLLELNYRKVNNFSELIKNDHKRIMEIINIVNKEICSLENWNFLLRKGQITIPQNTSEVDNTINGRILYLFIDNEKYNYTQNIEPFLKNKSCEKRYSVINDKLLFPKFKSQKVADVIYYTKNCVLDENNEAKDTFSSGTDKTVIPMPFGEQLLVYGTCLRLKGNPSYFKFSYWLSMYKEALANLKSKTSLDSQESPVVKLFRQ